MTTITKRERKAARQARVLAKLAQDVDRNRATLDQMIESDGWGVVVMTTKDPASDHPYFAYTVGLTAQGMPELCARGRDKTALKDMLNTLPAYVRATGETLTADTSLPLPDGGALLLTRVPEETFAEMFYAKDRYTFVRALAVHHLR